MSWMSVFFKVVGNLAVAATDFVIEKIPQAIVWLKKWWTGKTIAIIGPTATGKNSMFSRLRKETVPAEHIQTRGAEKVADFKISWPLPQGDHVDFYCRRSINIGGEIDERERYWLQACEGADVIFYLLDGEKLQLAPDRTFERFRDDMRWLVTNFRHFKPSVTVHLLLNKIDVTLGAYPYSPPALDSMAKLVQAIEEEAKDCLAEYFQRVTGVTPISMSDEHLFNKYFSGALTAIAELR
ncbi:GTPase domain-containing protein [Burkholderia cepacia]|uniref:GTPase domain-containing protein n=1 Tax=Burkholderia cepacia TaxID=292 RepID=UPI00158CEDE8|nr:GTPase domain-containing protein [Burkholderia cepacia]